MTAATIAANFLFMTFRIDRGTRRTAKRHAKKAAKKFLRQKTDEMMPQRLAALAGDGGARLTWSVPSD